MQDDCLDVSNKPLYKRRKILIPPPRGASFRAQKIALMLTWRCNYINYGNQIYPLFFIFLFFYPHEYA